MAIEQLIRGLDELREIVLDGDTEALGQRAMWDRRFRDYLENLQKIDRLLAISEVGFVRGAEGIKGMTRGAGRAISFEDLKPTAARPVVAPTDSADRANGYREAARRLSAFIGMMIHGQQATKESLEGQAEGFALTVRELGEKLQAEKVRADEADKLAGFWKDRAETREMPF